MTRELGFLVWCSSGRALWTGRLDVISLRNIMFLLYQRRCQIA